jgi:hypothetical protein
MNQPKRRSNLEWATHLVGVLLGLLVGLIVLAVVLVIMYEFAGWWGVVLPIALAGGAYGLARLRRA